MMDRELKNIIKLENRRQRNTIELIASENFVSKEIMKLTGSVLTNMYAVGYPLKRYYGGCKEIDKVETLAKERLLSIFRAHGYSANVQPHSGSQANMAVYKAVLDIGDTVLGYAEIKALAIGNPLIKKRVEVYNELTKCINMQRKIDELKQEILAEIDILPSLIERKYEEINNIVVDINKGICYNNFR